MANQIPGDMSSQSGIDFVFQAGEKKIQEQLSSAESLDVKMGVLIGFLGAIVTGLLAALLASDTAKVRPLLSNVIVDAVICALLGLFAADFYFAFQAFRMRKLYSGVRFQDLVKWANEDVSDTKRAFLPTLINTVVLNERQLTVKQRNAVRAMWFVFTTLLALLLTVAVIGAKFLKS
jgi:uncharacterized membrane protein YeaQ/YmgE (transglycosylase-associated protein family)